MSSKKEKTDRRLKKLMTSDKKANAEPAGKKVLYERTIQHYAETPFYTSLIMIAGIVVLFFIFTVIQNAIVADMCLAADPSLNGNNDALLAATNEFINSNPLYNIIRNGLLNIAGILAMMMLFYRLEKCEMISCGLFRTEKTKTDIGMGILFGFVSALVVYNVLALFGFIRPTGAFVFSYYQIAWTLYIISTVAFEELFFRGYLTFKFGGKNQVFGMILSGVVFALYKGLPSAMPSTYITYFVFGVMLAYSVKQFKTVWFAVAFRAIWYFFSAIVLSMDSAVIIGIVENEGLAENILSGSRAGCENGLIAGIVFAICFALIAYLNKKRTQPKIRKIHRDGTIR